MLIRLQLIVLSTACALGAQGLAAPVGAPIAQGDHTAVWIGEGAPPVRTGAISVHGADIRFEGPPVIGAPYSAEAVTDLVQTLADGNRIRHQNRTKVYRDGQGRTRREEQLHALGARADGSAGAEMIFINDPVAGLHWVIDPQAETARKMPIPQISAIGKQGRHAYSSSFRVIEQNSRFEHEVETEVSSDSSLDGESSSETSHVFIRRAPDPGQPSARLATADAGEAEIEELGERNVEGVLAKGVRRTRTIKAGQIGNERPIEVVFEEWRSEELGVTIKSVRSDPRSGVTTYTLKNLSRAEPLPALFEPPSGYEIIELPAFAKVRELHIEER